MIKILNACPKVKGQSLLQVGLEKLESWTKNETNPYPIPHTHSLQTGEDLM